jgi:hypothetical protein
MMEAKKGIAMGAMVEKSCNNRGLVMFQVGQSNCREYNFYCALRWLQFNHQFLLPIGAE